ncbi:MAG: Ig domain-containing protein, partial [Calditrichia bacterium]
FEVKTSDPDAEDQGKLSVTANGLPAGASFSGSTGKFSWVPRDDQQGSYQVTFVVKDPGGASAQRTVNITVEDVPPPPEEPTPNN